VIYALTEFNISVCLIGYKVAHINPSAALAQELLPREPRASVPAG
jgi:hypothetical protein